MKVTWAQLAAAAPEMAESGRRLLYRAGKGEALLATVRGDEPPRIHYQLFESTIASALLGRRATAGDSPPRYTPWTAEQRP